MNVNNGSVTKAINKTIHRPVNVNVIPKSMVHNEIARLENHITGTNNGGIRPGKGRNVQNTRKNNKITPMTPKISTLNTNLKDLITRNNTNIGGLLTNINQGKQNIRKNNKMTPMNPKISTLNTNLKDPITRKNTNIGGLLTNINQGKQNTRKNHKMTPIKTNISTTNLKGPNTKKNTNMTNVISKALAKFKQDLKDAGCKNSA